MTRCLAFFLCSLLFFLSLTACGNKKQNGFESRYCRTRNVVEVFLRLFQQA